MIIFENGQRDLILGNETGVKMDGFTPHFPFTSKSGHTDGR